MKVLLSLALLMLVGAVAVEAADPALPGKKREDKNDANRAGLRIKDERGGERMICNPCLPHHMHSPPIIDADGPGKEGRDADLLQQFKRNRGKPPIAKEKK